MWKLIKRCLRILTAEEEQERFETWKRIQLAKGLRFPDRTNKK